MLPNEHYDLLSSGKKSVLLPNPKKVNALRNVNRHQNLQDGYRAVILSSILPVSSRHHLAINLSPLLPKTASSWSPHRLLPAYTPVNCYVVFIYEIFQTASKAELNSIVSWFIGAPGKNRTCCTWIRKLRNGDEIFFFLAFFSDLDLICQECIYHKKIKYL